MVLHRQVVLRRLAAQDQRWTHHEPIHRMAPTARQVMHLRQSLLVFWQFAGASLQHPNRKDYE